jgi:hypothetical protein
MLDRERILGKLDALEGYLKELRAIAPKKLKSYKAIEKKQACVRLLQISIQTEVLKKCPSHQSVLYVGSFPRKIRIFPIYTMTSFR